MFTLPKVAECWSPPVSQGIGFAPPACARPTAITTVAAAAVPSRRARSRKPLRRKYQNEAKARTRKHDRASKGATAHPSPRPRLPANTPTPNKAQAGTGRLTRSGHPALPHSSRSTRKKATASASSRNHFTEVNWSIHAVEATSGTRKNERKTTASLVAAPTRRRSQGMRERQHTKGRRTPSSAYRK